jgi:type I restriction enzyme S subunit
MIPDGWSREALGNRIDIKHGYAFSSEFFNDAQQGYRLLTPGNFYEDGGFRDLKHKQKYYSGEIPNGYLLRKGDLLVAMTEQAPGLLGSSAVVPADNLYLHNQRLGLVVVRDWETTLPGFLFHLFNVDYVRKEIAVAAAGTKVRHTSPDKIKQVVCLFPPALEQRRIAEILCCWDDSIRSTEQLISAKVRLKGGLMQQLLTGRHRFREFRLSSWAHSVDGVRSPGGWPRVHIGEIASEVGARNGDRAQHPVLSCTKHEGLVDSMEYFGRRVFSEDTSNYKLVQRGQFAYATNHIEEGSIGLLTGLDAGLVSPMYTVFAANETIRPEFLYLVLKTEKYRTIFQACTSASVNRRGSLRWLQFSRIRVPLPTIAEQRRIVEVFAVLDREVTLLRQQLAALKTQKTALMHKLLTGQVRVNVSP